MEAARDHPARRPSGPATAGDPPARPAALGSLTRRDEAGQSLVELALTLPLLLLIVIGLADFGRAYYYSITLANAAREAAAYAARTAGATSADVARIACNETGFVAYNASCPAALRVQYTASADEAWDASVSVTVTYDMSLVSGYLVGRAFAVNPVTLSQSARFPLLR